MPLKPIISVIIPNYNGSKYLARCIDSICTQDTANIEIIVVDDGSTDSSIEILREYETQKKITLIVQENGGVSVARNTGLDSAHGEFICFVDSDDALESNALNVMKEQIENNDILVYTYSDYLEDGVVQQKHQLEAELSGGLLRNDIFYYAGKTLIYSPWNKLYRRSMLMENQIRFPHGIKNGEDFIFNMRAVGVANRVKFCDIPLYCYFDNPGSASYRVFPDRWKAQVAMVESVYALHPARTQYEIEFLIKRSLSVYQTYIKDFGIKKTAEILDQYWTKSTAGISLENLPGSLFYQSLLKLFQKKHFGAVCICFAAINKAVILKHKLS